MKNTKLYKMKLVKEFVSADGTSSKQAYGGCDYSSGDTVEEATSKYEAFLKTYMSLENGFDEHGTKSSYTIKCEHVGTVVI